MNSDDVIKEFTEQLLYGLEPNPVEYALKSNEGEDLLFTLQLIQICYEESLHCPEPEKYFLMFMDYTIEYIGHIYDNMILDFHPYCCN